jgi:hypothetical protein
MKLLFMHFFQLPLISCLLVTEILLGILGRGWEFFSSPPCPEWFWGPPSLLSNGLLGALSLEIK